jgi:hypothetical protein
VDLSLDAGQFVLASGAEVPVTAGVAVVAPVADGGVEVVDGVYGALGEVGVVEVLAPEVDAFLAGAVPWLFAAVGSGHAGPVFDAVVEERLEVGGFEGVAFVAEVFDKVAPEGLAPKASLGEGGMGSAVGVLLEGEGHGVVGKHQIFVGGVDLENIGCNSAGFIESPVQCADVDIVVAAVDEIRGFLVPRSLPVDVGVVWVVANEIRLIEENALPNSIYAVTPIKLEVAPNGFVRELLELRDLMRYR